MHPELNFHVWSFQDSKGYIFYEVETFQEQSNRSYTFAFFVFCFEQLVEQLRRPRGLFNQPELRFNSRDRIHEFKLFKRSNPGVGSKKPTWFLGKFSVHFRNLPVPTASTRLVIGSPARHMGDAITVNSPYDDIIWRRKNNS
mmetsp:Transcript_13126/g.28441  ORF Transcript_13126/g.28441 Transcript_13126/m.28441 type:complete len:142 (+) Transcript_13126:625-1050(+)